MENQEKDILLKAADMFMKYGIRSVTMDDLSREMGVSKKTIYKFVENKAELVHKCIEYIHTEISALIEGVYSKPGNAIDRLIEVDNAVCNMVDDHDPGLEFQLQKYYPETMQTLDKERRKMVVEKMRANMEQGIKEGLYRDDFNVEIITQLYYSRMMLMVDEENNFPLQNFTKLEVMHNILVYHIRGIATSKGIAYLEKKLKEKNLIHHHD